VQNAAVCARARCGWQRAGTRNCGRVWATECFDAFGFYDVASFLGMTDSHDAVESLNVCLYECPPSFSLDVSFCSQWQIPAEVCQEQELYSENTVSSTLVKPPGTLFLPNFTTLPTPVPSEKDSRVFFLIVLTTDYCRRSWTCRIAAPFKFRIDLIDLI